MKAPVRIAVVGAGLIGRRHIEAVNHSSHAVMAAVVDPAEHAEEIAGTHGIPHFRDLAEAITSEKIDGVILATPNQLHADGALEAISRGLPVLVEKPLASSLAGGRRIVDAGATAGVPVLTGHHRRHNPIIATARELIANGSLGRIVALHATTWFYKPDEYFDVAWRKEAGGGPININLIHDIDLLQHFAGAASEVHALSSSAVRGFAVEDTAVISLRFASGALGTMTLSDTAVAPWSWELTARENPAYPATSEAAYLIAGTKSSLALPNLALWSHPDTPSWWSPISSTQVPIAFADPFERQIDQFADVISNGAAPLVSGEDGLGALAAVEAVRRSAETGQTVRITDLIEDT